MSYNMFVAQKISTGVVDIQKTIQNMPSHHMIVVLLEQIMNYNDGIVFREHIELVAYHFKNYVSTNNVGCQPKFPKEPSDYYKTDQVQSFASTFGKTTVGCTPLSVLAYALSFVNCGKNYTITPNIPLIELATASDNAYLIDGLLNTHTTPHLLCAHNKHLPADLVVQVKKSKLKNNNVPMVVLFIPSIGIFLSPLFEGTNSRLQAMGSHFGSDVLAKELYWNSYPLQPYVSSGVMEQLLLVHFSLKSIKHTVFQSLIVSKQ